jgi:hypothetical protein
VYSLLALGFLLEARSIGVWLELLRTAGTAALVAISRRWFGVGHLDARVAVGVAGAFGIGAMVLLLVAHYERRHADAARRPDDFIRITKLQ